MVRSRTIAISLAALTVTACAHKTLQDSATTRFDTAPLASYPTTAETHTLSRGAVTQAARLATADVPLDEDLLDNIGTDHLHTTSARSSISLL